MTLVVVVTVFLLGGGWYFSGQIRSGALEVHASPNEMTLEVMSVSPTSVTLTETGEREDPLRHDDVYGLAWSGGYGQVSGEAQVSGDGPGIQHWGLEVSDPKAVAETVKQSGGSILPSPQGGAVRFRGPDGNVAELRGRASADRAA